MKSSAIWVFYLIAFAIPVGLVVVGIFAPGVFGLESIDEYWDVFDRTVEEAGIHPRGAALMPFVRVSLIRPMFWTMNIYAAAPTIAAVITALLYFGWQGVWDLVDRLRPWREGVAASEGLRWWGLMIVLLAALKMMEFGSVVLRSTESNGFTWVAGVAM